MKNLAKIFMAIVGGGLLAFSCTTDTTEDLGIQGVNGVGQTTITLSLEEARTQLGAENKGFYPLLWSEGDQISVNGVASDPLTAEQAGSATATFTVAVSAESYNIAYPAAAEGQVEFAVNQLHTANDTFGNGVTTMYAKCAAGEAVNLQHLTAILKIGVTGSATVTHAQISTIDRAPIAGAFAINDEGEVSATNASATVINYSFGEGVTLSEEPTYIHAAVPAGVYSELYVTLYDSEGGVMYATVKAGEEKPLTAGKLRKFNNNITYVATDKVFLIKTYSDLEDFAANASTLTDDVVLANDIEVTGDWTPIEGYAGTFYGHGYAIKGLTAPLFGTTSASFNGLHLEGVAINETTTPNVGAFARAIVASDTVKPIFENCSASGTLVVNCAEHTFTEGAYVNYAIGGLVGRIQGVVIKDCVNNIDIDVDQIVALTNTSVLYPSIAGIVGLVDQFTRTDASIVLSNLSDLENNGNVIVDTPICDGCSNYENKIVPYIAGVAAFFTDSNGDCIVSNLTNRGEVTATGYHGQGATDPNNSTKNYIKDAVNYADIDSCIAGVVGYLDAKEATNLYNHNQVRFPSGRSRHQYMGGIVGMCGEGVVMNTLHNYGAVATPAAAYIASLHCGGIIAHSREGASLTNGVNRGNLNIKNKPVGGDNSHRYWRIGGVVAFSRGLVKDCSNHVDVTCDAGTISVINHWQDVAIGGVVAVAYTNPVTDCTNNGRILVKVTGITGGSEDNEQKRITIGGVAGIVSIPCSNVTNNARVETWSNHHKLYMGGVVGDMNYGDSNYADLGGYYNNGVVVVREATTFNYTAAIGGCVGYAKGLLNNVHNYNAKGFEINGAITNVSSHTYIGGCVGWSAGVVNGASNAASVKIPDGSSIVKMLCFGGCVGRAQGSVLSATNTGHLTLGEGGETPVTAATACCVGGIVGKSDIGADDGRLEEVTNNGNINVNYSNTNASHIGGILGQVDDADITVINTADNYGAITLNNIATGTAYVAGISPYLFDGGSNLTNHDTGDITVTGTNSGETYVSGIGDYVKANSSNFLNQGDISINGTLSGLTLIAGISANAAAAVTLTEMKNEGNITFNADFTFNANEHLRIAGLQANSNFAQTWVDSYNSGDITISKDASTVKGTYSQYMFVAGLSAALHENNQTYQNCYNSGDITVEEGASIVKGPYTGGCFGWVSGAKPVVAKVGDLYNTGNVSVYNAATATTNNYVGGIAGYASVVLSNIQSVCNIVAPGVKGAGAVRGNARGNSNAASACQFGGQIAKELDSNSEPVWRTIIATSNTTIDEVSGEETTDPTKVPFWEVIYGVAWADASISNCDGCSHISAITIE